MSRNYVITTSNCLTPIDLPLVNNTPDININIYNFLDNDSYNCPDPCRGCSNHPSNGGSGICHCTLGSPSVTC